MLVLREHVWVVELIELIKHRRHLLHFVHSSLFFDLFYIECQFCICLVLLIAALLLVWIYNELFHWRGFLGQVASVRHLYRDVVKILKHHSQPLSVFGVIKQRALRVVFLHQFLVIEICDQLWNVAVLHEKSEARVCLFERRSRVPFRPHRDHLFHPLCQERVLHLLPVVCALLHERPYQLIASFCIRLNSVEKYSANQPGKCLSVRVSHQNAIVLRRLNYYVPSKDINLVEEFLVLFLLVGH